ncbi:hypothetical protein EVAR_101459_1 [Eumeta japonica]|uniref:Uncharacterized protein n=1 Tax=Eumeta variegata TaxID=151549 RepID=A0A4C1TMB4_EUMVA|nr:hypothetical protein EVAR_101459_1 [Eumeta japonica]
MPSYSNNARNSNQIEINSPKLVGIVIKVILVHASVGSFGICIFRVARPRPGASWLRLTCAGFNQLITSHHFYATVLKDLDFKLPSSFSAYRRLLKTIVTNAVTTVATDSLMSSYLSLSVENEYNSPWFEGSALNRRFTGVLIAIRSMGGNSLLDLFFLDWSPEVGGIDEGVRVGSVTVILADSQVLDWNQVIVAISRWLWAASNSVDDSRLFWFKR